MRIFAMAPGCAVQAFLRMALCVGRDTSVRFVAMSGLTQTIGFLGMFVKLIIPALDLYKHLT
jgi:hypothetical protein